MVKNGKKNSDKNRGKWHEGLKQETKQSILGIFSFALGVLFILAPFGKAGVLGDTLQKGLKFLFGGAFFLVPLMFFVAGLSFLFSIRRHFVLATLIGAAMSLFSALGLVEIILGTRAGGYVGFAIEYPFVKLLDVWVSGILLSALAASGILIMFNASLQKLVTRKEKKENENLPVISEQKLPMEVVEPKINLPKRPEPAAKEERSIPAPPHREEDFISAPIRRRAGGSALIPPLDLLESDKGEPSSGDIKANSNIIKRTLLNFGIDVEMAEINVGPSVTQYTLKPAEGVKLAKITALQNDLALALAAHPLRIEAPIPGRSLVGIEVPNRSIKLVGLRSLFSSEEFQKSGMVLPFALGQDVSGNAVYADLARLPHILIAGATGSGKSVAIHSLLMSILYKNPPDTLGFIMIDPKRVELTGYARIPHLLAPVITDAKKTIISLKWAAREMERRYEILEKSGVRDIRSYHANVVVKDPEADPMPYIIIVIDELADIMATYPRELEASIVRLAQMSRAVGIHLILSTQRPSVEVITGLIKANITSRMALQVVSGVDSRTILDATGADKLLGNGDMLFLAGDSAKPRRIQGAFVSEREVKKVVSWLREHSDDAESKDIFASSDNENEGMTISLEDFSDADEALYEEAKRIAIEAGKISASFMQRRLKVGYARAARLLDMMEERGIIGPADGAKPREVLMRPEKFVVRDPSADELEKANLYEAKKRQDASRERKGDSSGAFPDDDGEFFNSF